MTSQSLVKVLTLVFAFFLSSCGGGGDDSSMPAGLPLSALAGTWSGTLEDPVGIMHELSVTVDGSGNITQILVDTIDQGTTGTITKVGASVFGVAFSDASEGGFIADASGTHAGLLDDSFDFGVLQKGAGALPAYVSADIVGPWSGYGVMLDANFDVTQTFASSATVANDLTFTGSDIGGAFSGSFITDPPTLGRWIGSYTQGTDVGEIRAFLSVDKTFAATWACSNAPGSVFPDDCSFRAGNR